MGRRTLGEAASPIRANKLEINPVEHCNLSCRSCSHLSPIQPRYECDPGELETDLDVLARHYHARWLRLVGGEPLLHSDLVGVLRAARGSGIADRIVLVTNGVLLGRMPTEAWRLLDRVDVSQYPGKQLDSVALARLRETADRHGVRLYVDRVDEFRVAYSESGSESPELVQRIYDSCAIVHELRCHTVARGHFYKCPQSYFLSRTIPTVDSQSDRVAISDRPTLRDELRQFLGRDMPLDGCRHCLGTAGKRFEHQQIRRADFSRPQAQATELLVDERYLSSSYLVRRRAAQALRDRLGRDRR